MGIDFISCVFSGYDKLHYTVDLVIFACLHFREFLILGLFTKFKIRVFSFFCSSDIIKKIS